MNKITWQIITTVSIFAVCIWNITLGPAQSQRIAQGRIMGNLLFWWVAWAPPFNIIQGRSFKISVSFVPWLSINHINKIWFFHRYNKLLRSQKYQNQRTILSYMIHSWVLAWYIFLCSSNNYFDLLIEKGMLFGSDKT